MNELWKNNLRQIEPYVPGEQSKDKNIVKLNANENPYPPSPQAVRALKDFDTDALRFYPPATASQFKEAIAEYYGVKAHNVFLGNGSDDVLALSFQAFFNSESPIAFPDITYSFYSVWCRLFDIDYVTHPLDDNFRINPDDYKEKNGGVVLPNPNAPTSIGEEPDFVRHIMEHNRDSVVIIDEAYADFAESTCVPLTAEYENLLITGTFSKSRSLAGLRIGFAIGSKTLIDVLEAVKNGYNSYTIDSLSMAMGIASIRDVDYFNATVSRIKCTRTRVTNALRALGFTVQDSSTNFLMATHPNHSMKELFLYLRSKNVFVRYFDLPRINNYVRITIGTDDEMDVFLERVKEYLN